MKLVTGLGNVPAARYGFTRHNVGFDVVDCLAARNGLTWPKRFDVVDRSETLTAVEARWKRPDGDVLLVKPLVLMNRSGWAVRDWVEFYKIATQDILVVCDDVNLPLGRLRARASGSEGGHNGLRSVAEYLGTTDYARLRVGVGRGDPRWDLADHVLSKFDESEVPVIRKAVERAADAVETWVTEGLARMMNTFNREPEPLS